MLRKKCAIALSIVLMFSSLSYSPAYAQTSESESIVNQEVFTTSTETCVAMLHKLRKVDLWHE